jgi:hypothetical protein
MSDDNSKPFDKYSLSGELELAVVQQACLALRQATIAHEVAECAYTAAIARYASNTLFAKHVYSGDVVTVEYAEGPQRAVYVGITSACRNTDEVITVRHYNAKGKLLKRTHDLPYTMANHINNPDKPKEQQ